MMKIGKVIKGFLDAMSQHSCSSLVSDGVGGIGKLKRSMLKLESKKKLKRGMLKLESREKLKIDMSKLESKKKLKKDLLMLVITRRFRENMKPNFIMEMVKTCGIIKRTV